MDFWEGEASSSHFECLTNAGNVIGIWNPSVTDVFGSIAPPADIYGFALEATGRGARDCTVGLYKVAQTADHILAEIFEETSVHPVDGGLEKPAFGAIRDVVGQGDNFVSSPAQIGLIELGIIDVTREPGHFPHDNAFFFRVPTEVAHEGLELVAPDDGTARASGVDEPGGDGAAVLHGPAFNGLALLVGGEFLAVAT